MSGRRICVVTGSRAEYGLLYWVIKELQADADLVLQVAVTGMHLAPEFGSTYRVIEEDGIMIDAKVEMLLSSDTPVGIAKSIGLGVIGFADAFERLRPDLVVLLGDRFEILAAAEAALVARIPVAHIAGGDTTEGAFDEAIRHSITKMSHLHFVTNEEAARRIRQLGEDPEHVYLVGNPGLDHIKRLNLLSREEFEGRLGIKLCNKNILVTFHPETLNSRSPSDQFNELVIALGRMDSETCIIFTKPNADSGGRTISHIIDNFVSSRKNSYAFTSLGQLLYLSALSHVDIMVGNSSSGLGEAPSFCLPTVNIGDRQKGRLLAESVINCSLDADDIEASIDKAFMLDCTNVVNPYGDGNSSKKIVKLIKDVVDCKALLKKHFYEV